MSFVRMNYLDSEESLDGIREASDDKTLRLYRLLEFGESKTCANCSPLIERLGFSGGKLMSLRAFKEGPLNKKRLMQYATPPLPIAEVSSTDYLFSRDLYGARSTADFSKDRVVWLEEVPSMGLNLVSCPYNAAGFSGCSNPESPGYPPDKLVPLDIKAFAISPEAEIGVIAEVNGTIKYASLPTMTTMPPPLAWNAPGNTPPPATNNERVLLALGELTGDRAPDLLAIHMKMDGSGQEVRIYKGDSGSGSLQLTFDAGLSSAWQNPLSKSAAIGAIAVGDLDNDGRADVAVGSGNTVTVWLNPAMGAPAQGGLFQIPMGQIRALRIGQADGTGPNDLVVASSTTADPTTAMQYLYAYLGQ
jgi:hypothetical protein